MVQSDNAEPSSYSRLLGPERVGRVGRGGDRRFEGGSRVGAYSPLLAPTRIGPSRQSRKGGGTYLERQGAEGVGDVRLPTLPTRSDPSR